MAATSRAGGSRTPVPWRAMLASPAVHALWVTHTCSAFGYYLLIINLSLFIREALGFTVLNVGITVSAYRNIFH